MDDTDSIGFCTGTYTAEGPEIFGGKGDHPHNHRRVEAGNLKAGCEFRHVRNKDFDVLLRPALEIGRREPERRRNKNV
ncbi:MAG: hypothetical protein ABIK65_09500 [Candidatus Eisenbacteria bacterium]